MLFALLALLSPAQADCMSGSLAAFPPAGATLPADDPVVVLQAYGSERPTLDALDGDDLALVRGDDRIPLERVATHRGSFADDQAVLTPTRTPSAGTWTLEVSHKPFTAWSGGKHVPITWTVSEGQPDAPRWTAAPEVVDRDRAHFGCGPAVWIDVLIPATDAAWVEATVRPLGGDPVTAMLHVDDGRIRLGHGMCSGLFELTEGTTYEVNLTAVGLDGRRAASPYGALRFEAP